MTARTVILEKPAEEALDAGIAQFPGLDEVYQALEWRICRDPEAGRLIKVGLASAYVIRSKEWIKTPSLVLMYRYTEVSVTILRARVRPFDVSDTVDESAEVAS